MVVMELRTSQLLPPFIILSGGFCKKLMKKSQISLTDHNPLVIFTKKHSQEEETNMIWLTFVHNRFTGKVIRTCYDYAPSHTKYNIE